MNTANLLILAQAAAPAGALQQQSPLSMMVPFVFIFIIFYFLLIRPQQKKAKEHAKLVSALKTGDSVVTSAGIHGVISNIKDKTVVVKIADNVKVEFDRAAIVTVESSSSAESAA